MQTTVWTTSKNAKLNISEMAYPHIQNVINKIERNLETLKSNPAYADEAVLIFNNPDYREELSTIKTGDQDKADAVVEICETWLEALKAELAKRPPLETEAESGRE